MQLVWEVYGKVVGVAKSGVSWSFYLWGIKKVSKHMKGILSSEWDEKNGVAENSWFEIVALQLLSWHSKCGNNQQ